MIKGKTKSGFEFAIDEKKLDDMELLEALVDADDGDSMKKMKGLNAILNKFFGEDGKKKLYEHLREEDGRVPVTRVSEVVVEIMQAGNSTKKS